MFGKALGESSKFYKIISSNYRIIKKTLQVLTYENVDNNPGNEFVYKGYPQSPFFVGNINISIEKCPSRFEVPVSVDVIDEFYLIQRRDY
jgi:hypothetical protein